jgi:3-oxoacyl-[acyl-carrier protein] reductase
MTDQRTGTRRTHEQRKQDGYRHRSRARYWRGGGQEEGFTKSPAIELGKFGVTANAIAPGFIDTEMTATTAARMGIDFDALKQSAAAQIPVNRVGQPEDVANLASFLAGDGAGFISGQVIYVAGGPKD